MNKKPVLKNFTIFTKNTCVSKETLFNKETPTQVFSCEYCENFKDNYFEDHVPTAASAIGQLETIGDSCDNPLEIHKI